MKLCTFKTMVGPHLAVKTDQGIADLNIAGYRGNMDDLIYGGEAELQHAKQTLAHAPVIISELEMDRLCYPQKILCVGLNYRSHAAETEKEAPKQPILFSKFTNALSASGMPVQLPPVLKQYDYEAELVIVIGKPCYQVSEEDALDYVFGYTCGNDLSARDGQFISGQWLIGKTLPGFAPAGPFIVTPDEFNPNEPHRITCRRNGQIVQDSNTSHMIFNCAQIISYASQFMRLVPGDLIFTGTPEGVILGKPEAERNWLVPGDTLEVTIEGIGTLTNQLV